VLEAVLEVVLESETINSSFKSLDFKCLF